MGANGDDCASGVDCGSAYVYDFIARTWTKLTAPDGGPDHGFGGSVSMSGDVALIGASGDGCCGSAYVYRFSGGSWIQQAKLTASDAGAVDLFGGSVSISGNAALVGAGFDDCAAGLDCGSAYVYRFDRSTWVQETKLTASDAGAHDSFGTSVSIDGNVVVVGAYSDDCAAGNDCGAAYVYRFDGSSWVQETKLTALDAESGDLYGSSLGVSGDVVVVGAYRDDCAAGSDCGSAYVYRFNPGAPEQWVFEHCTAKPSICDAPSLGRRTRRSRSRCHVL